MSQKPEMTSKERLWVTLNGGEPDRVPWAPCVSPYYQIGHPRAGEMSHLDYYLEMGADALLRMVPLGATAWENPPEVKTISDRKDNELYTRLETPVGAVTSVGVVLPTSPWIPFPKKRFVCSREDLKTLMWVQERQVWKPIVTASMVCSALQYLLEIVAGAEVFYDLLFTVPEEVEAFMNVYHAQALRFHELVTESPAEVVIGYENTGTSNLSPALYRKYVKDHLDAYADIIRGAGKVYLNHDCGLLKGLEDQIRDGHQNGRIDVARQPTGNFDFARRLELTGDKVMIGGIDATAFTTLTPDEMKDHVREFLREAAPGRYFALGSGDAIPMHTPPEVLAAVGQVIAEEGVYPLSL